MGQRQTRTYVTAIAAAGAVTLGSAVSHVEHLTGAAVLAVALGAVLHASLVKVRGRPGGTGFTVDELALPLLLLFPPPVTILIASAAALLGQVLMAKVSPFAHRRRLNPWAVSFNVGSVALAAAAAAAAVSVWSQPRSLPAVMAGVTVWAAVLAASTAVVVRLSSASTWREALEGNRSGLPASLGAGFIGYVLVGDGTSLVALVVAVAAVAVGSSLMLRLTVERRDRRSLQQAAERIHRASRDGRTAEALTAAAAEALHATTVVLSDEPESFEIAVPVAGHGWLCASGRDAPTSRRLHPADAATVRGIAAIGAVALDNESLVGELRDAEDHRAVLMAAASHDLRTPLAAVTGAVETLRAYDDRLSADQRDRLLSSIARSGDAAARMVADLLEVERSALAAPPVGLTSVTHVLREVLSQLEPADVIVETSDDLAPVAIPAAVLERVLDNLVRNAVKHTPEGTSVTVELRQHSDEVLITVGDRGPGVPLELRGRLFDPFIRGTAPTAGVGLGLHVVRALVVRYGGRVWSQDRDGGGACFCVGLKTVADGSPHTGTERRVSPQRPWTATPVSAVPLREAHGS